MFSAASGFTNKFGTTGQDSLLSKNLLGNSLPSDYYPLYCKRFQGTPTTGWAKGPLVLFVSFFFFSSMPQGMRDTSSPTRVQTYTPAVEVEMWPPNHWTAEKTPWVSLPHLICLTNDSSICCWSRFSLQSQSLDLLDFFKLNRAGSRPFYSSGIRKRSLQPAQPWTGLKPLF